MQNFTNITFISIKYSHQRDVYKKRRNLREKRPIPIPMQDFWNECFCASMEIAQTFCKHCSYEEEEHKCFATTRRRNTKTQRRHQCHVVLAHETLASVDNIFNNSLFYHFIIIAINLQISLFPLYFLFVMYSLIERYKTKSLCILEFLMIFRATCYL